MAMLEYTQEENGDRIQGRVWAGPDLKQEGEFQIDMARTEAGWGWTMKVEIGDTAVERTQTEADQPYENLTWREAVALAKTGVTEQAEELAAELGQGAGPAPEKEATGGRFRVFPSKEAAEEYVQTLPPSQQNRIDQALEAGGPTDSYVVTTGPLPSVKEVARDEYVAQQVAAIEDPATRTRAEQLLQTIREEAAAREQPTPTRSQEVELER